jgi:hypothetical protein
VRPTTRSRHIGLNASPTYPPPYQFLAWLKLWHIDALKEAVRCTARWVKRQMERGEEIDSDDLIRYFSATARNIHSAKEAAESLEVPNE